MDEKTVDQFELMDPDFGRGILVGTGFGSISEEEYTQLVNELQK
jgi:hypothetical protein